MQHVLYRINWLQLMQQRFRSKCASRQFQKPCPIKDYRYWRNVLFTDESRFCLLHNDSQIRMWRQDEFYTRDHLRWRKVHYGMWWVNVQWSYLASDYSKRFNGIALHTRSFKAEVAHLLKIWQLIPLYNTLLGHMYLGKRCLVWP